MADKVIAVAQFAGHVVRLLLEVDPLERRTGRITAARDEHALEAIGQRALLRPGRLGVAHAAVDEHDPRHN